MKADITLQFNAMDVRQTKLERASKATKETPKSRSARHSAASPRSPSFLLAAARLQRLDGRARLRASTRPGKSSLAPPKRDRRRQDADRTRQGREGRTRCLDVAYTQLPDGGDQFDDWLDIAKGSLTELAKTYEGDQVSPDIIIPLVVAGLDLLATMAAKGEVTPEKLAEVKSKYEAVGGDWDAAVKAAKRVQASESNKLSPPRGGSVGMALIGPLVFRLTSVSGMLQWRHGDRDRDVASEPQAAPKRKDEEPRRDGQARPRAPIARRQVRARTRRTAHRARLHHPQVPHVLKGQARQRRTHRMGQVHHRRTRRRQHHRQRPQLHRLRRMATSPVRSPLQAHRRRHIR